MKVVALELDEGIDVKHMCTIEATKSDVRDRLSEEHLAMHYD